MVYLPQANLHVYGAYDVSFVCDACPAQEYRAHRIEALVEDSGSMA